MSHPSTTQKTDLLEFGFWVMMAYALFTWFSIQINNSITADTLWLCDAAGRWLAGQRMSDAYYDTNPPLSVLLYVPPVLAVKTGLITLHHAVFGYILLILGISAAITYRFLKAVPDIDMPTALTATAALIISNTILITSSFTERDQIVGIVLIPFVLAQVAMTKKWPLPPVLKHVALFAGALLVLVKPHHGLLPTMILIHRAISEKRFTVWKDADFLYLAGAVLAYAAVLIFFFDDYLHIIMPDVAALYLNAVNAFALWRALFYATIFLAALLFAIIFGAKSWMGFFMIGAAFISLIPFIVQMRGYHYQLLPAQTFFCCGIAILAKDALQKYMTQHYAMIVTTLIMIVVSFGLTPARLTLPTHEQYKELPLAKFLESCESPCPVFVLNDHIEIIHQTALYSDKPWASRFPSFWFLPGIFDTDKTLPEEFIRYREKYGRMVAEDLAHYKPKLVLLGEFRVKEGEFFNFLDFFSAEEPFRKEWAHYKKKNDFIMDQSVYFKGTSLGKPNPMTYQVFERRE